MAEDKLTTEDVENIKKALVGAGILKSTSLDKAEEARLQAELSKHGIEALKWPFSWKIICHSNHYCIVVRDIN
jgi:hypothetical protein